MSKLKPYKLLSVLLVSAFLTAFLVYPLAGLLYKAFIVSGRPTLIFFKVLVSTPGTLEIYLRSINLALAVTVASSCIALPLAVVLSRYSFAAKGLAQTGLLIPLILPPFVGALGIRKILARFGALNLLLLDTGVIKSPVDFLGAAPFWGVVLTEALHLFPVLCLNLMAAFGRIDASLEDAASSVGAPPLKKFWRITFPLLVPGYFAGACLVFIAALTDLGTPLVFDYRELVPVKIFEQIDEIQTNPVGYVLVTLLLITTLLIFLLARLVFPKGNAAESQKGRALAPAKKLGWGGQLAVWLGLAPLLFVAILPHLSVLLASLSERWFMSAWPTSFTLENFRQVWQHPLTVQGLKNSLFLSLGSTMLCCVLGTAMGLIITRGSPALRQFTSLLSLAPLALPGIVVAFAYIGTFSGTFLDPRLNPVALLVCGYAVRRLPFMVRAAVAGFESSSVPLEEAASSVGASPRRVLFRITLPLMYGNLLAGAILCFSFSMLEVSESLVLAMEERFYPLTKAMYALLGRPDGPLVAAALGVVGMLVIGFCLFIARQLLGKRFGDVFGA